MCAYLLHQVVISMHVFYPPIELGNDEYKDNFEILATKCTMIYIYWTVKVLPNHWALCIHGEHTYRFNQPYFLDRKISRKEFCQGTGGVAQSAKCLTNTGLHLQHRRNQTLEARGVDRMVRRSRSLLATRQAQGQPGLCKNTVSEGTKNILFWS